MSSNLDIIANQAQIRVMASLKMVAASPCYVHTDRFACGCPDAMSNLTLHDHLWNKRIWYCMFFENLLLDKDHAFNYNGDKASHDAFLEAEKITPKHFVRDFLKQNNVAKGFASQIFVPSGRLDTTIQATIDMWIARNKQWLARYPDRQTAQKKWIDDAYPDHPELRVAEVPEDRPDLGPGDSIMVPVPTAMQWVEYHEGEHGFKARLSVLRTEDVVGRTPYGVCIEEVGLCHLDKPCCKELFEKKLPDAAKYVLPKLRAEQSEMDEQERHKARAAREDSEAAAK